MAGQAAPSSVEKALAWLRGVYFEGFGAPSESDDYGKKGISKEELARLISEVPEYDSERSRKERLKRRLELRDLFRDKQLFEESLPFSRPSSERLRRESHLKTWTDWCISEAQFVPMDSTRVFFSSFMSGVIVSCISTPFDVVKNFWIYHPMFQSVRTGISTREVVRAVYNKGGYRAFYTGFGATLCTIVPSNFIFFSIYEDLRMQEPPAIAGVKARAFALVLTCPCEYVRTRLQANAGEFTFMELWRTLNHVERLRHLIKGVVATLCRDAPFSAIYWTLNERGKEAFLKYDSEYAQRNTFTSKFVYPFVSGAASAGVATAITQPLDVIKTTIQGNDNVFRRRGAYYFRSNGMVTVAANIYKTAGYRGFFVGLVPRVAKIMPSCAMLLASYDFTKALFTSDPVLDYDGL